MNTVTEGSLADRGGLKYGDQILEVCSRLGKGEGEGGSTKDSQLIQIQIREIVDYRQLKFMGHITHKEGLENLALTGKIVGRRRILWMDSLQKLLEERGVKELGVGLIQKARSRGLWYSMIAKVNRYGT